MTPDQIAAEIARLQTMLRAREGKAGYTANVAAIKARIAELQAMTPE